MDIQPILQQIANGNRQAFTAIVEYFQRPLFGYLGRMGLTQAQAEELAQETFLRAWQNLGQFDIQRAAFSTWLFTIARNLALNELQRASNRMEVAQDVTVDPACSTATPAENTEQQEQQRRLQAAMRQLPLQERSLLALMYTQGLDIHTIARIEGCSEGAAKVRLHRAREKLRHWLGDNDG